MTRRSLTASVALIALMTGTTAWAHELWFLPDPGSDPTLTRLYFGDSPAPGEAERVSEIAHTKVWIDGKSVDVKRLPDGLEVKLPTHRPEIISAYADRGIIDYEGDSFVITLAAYAQSRPVKNVKDLKLGLDDDQLRLLLVASEGGSPVVKAIWKDKPAADVVVKVFRGTAESTEFRTDAKGELACPDLTRGGVSLLAQLEDKTPGQRDGKKYSKIRYKATLTLAKEASPASK
jgi:hypothetical protein